MNQTETAKKITTYLDKGTAQLKAGTAYKLQAARQAALDAMRLPQHSSELALADSRGGSHSGGRPLLSDARLWIGMLLLVGGVLFFQNWQIAQQTRDIEEIDAALLTSELPIEAYLDRGFQNWLRQPQP
ncbi:MAG TPA: DUF3619 family protein [Casimicrobiaceae bacterium]|jgi:hypothetical protein|nr:DUF3619 family protein [Casimicrobiaceae bacterium]